MSIPWTTEERFSSEPGPPGARPGSKVANQMIRAVRGIRDDYKGKKMPAHVEATEKVLNTLQMMYDQYNAKAER